MATQPPMPPREPLDIAVAADPAKDVELLRAAARIAVDINIPFMEKPSKTGHEMLLVVTAQRLELRVLKGEKDMRGGNPVFAELGDIDTRSNAGRSLDQPLLKAIGLKRRPTAENPGPTIIDATGGWGEDAWLMASMGCRVLVVERNKIVHTLLRDALLRAGAGDPSVLMRINPVRTDARHLLRRIARIDANHLDPADDVSREMKGFLEPDVIYLDPMFPDAAGRKTAERKAMKVLRRLVGDDEDAAELLDLALRAARQRVVVKRPIKADPLGGVKPKVSHKGKSLRYDVYVP